MPRATGKNHAEINLDIWGDDDWLDLTPPAQHLYFVLWTSPELSHCGCGPWHPGRIAAKARGWTPAAVEAAAAELSAELFLIVDTTTEEFDLRSWIKHDGIWRKPNMAVAMASARAALASRTLRGVVVHEVAKIKARNIAEANAENPISSSWERDAVKDLLKQKPIDPASLPPFTPTETYALTPGLTPVGTPDVTPPLTVNGTVRGNPPPNPGPTPTPSPSPTPILQRGYVTGERHQGAEPDPAAPRPSDRCPKHRNHERVPACGDCADARHRAEAWDEAREAKIAAERQTAADLRRRCTDCDESGWLLDDNDQPVEPAHRCTHIALREELARA